MDFDLTPEQTMLRDSVRTMMQRTAPPEQVRRLEREGAYPYELYQAWAEMGLMGLPFPEQYGGVGGSVVDLVLVGEELARSSFDLYTGYAGTVLCGLTLLRMGNDAQRQGWIPKLISGDKRMTISISEPEAGSDVGAMRTSAVQRGDTWILNGQKLWSSGAGASNNVINVYARTDPNVSYRQGTSLFLVDNDAPGVTLRRLEMLGRRSLGTYEVFFDDVAVPVERVVGSVNSGWNCLMSGLQTERVMSSAGYCGAAQAALDLALQHAKERVQFGRPIGSNQAIAHMLVDLQVEVDAARLLLWRAAALLDSGRDALREVSMAKLFGSEAYVKVANAGMQVLGASGYSMELDMQRHYRDARSTTIGAGTSQMQRNLIAGLMGLKVR